MFYCVVLIPYTHRGPGMFYFPFLHGHMFVVLIKRLSNVMSITDSCLSKKLTVKETSVKRKVRYQISTYCLKGMAAWK